MALILVIDDSSVIRCLMRAALTDAGHTVIEAADGQAGLALFHSRRPHLVITDLVMPVKDGIETIREIRKCDPETPILAISEALDSVEYLYLNAAKKLGAHVTLSKPFSPADLQRAVDSLLACEELPALRSIGARLTHHTAPTSSTQVTRSDHTSRAKERRRSSRHAVVWSGQVEVSNGIRIDCAVLDISAEGAKIILTHAIPAGEQVVFRAPRFDPMIAQLAWAEGPTAGLRFLDGLDHVLKALGGKDGEIVMPGQLFSLPPARLYALPRVVIPSSSNHSDP
jgi:CheY-like chemotaxis protein